VKLGNLGVKFIVDGVDSGFLSDSRPTRLMLNGNSSYVVCCMDWGFSLRADDEMIVSMLSKYTGSYHRRDLGIIVVDCKDFLAKDKIAKMEQIRNAIVARGSVEYGEFASGAINWWIDQERDKDNQSP
jgi:hypothetical protein